MIKYVTMFEIFRKRAALSMAILVLGLVFFITYLSSSLNELDENINNIQEYEEEAMNSFLDIALEMDRNFLNVLEQQWKNIPDFYSMEEKIDIFKRQNINVTLGYSVLSVVLVYEDEDLTMISYVHECYDDLFNINDHEIQPGQDLIVLDNDDGCKNVRFGEGNRVFLSGRELDANSVNQKLFVYVGFHEQVRVLDFVNTTDLEMLQENKRIINETLNFSIFFMVAAIVYGVVLLMIIRWFTSKTVKWYAKDYLTEEQARECLRQQDFDSYDYLDEKED